MKRQRPGREAPCHLLRGAGRTTRERAAGDPPGFGEEVGRAEHFRVLAFTDPLVGMANRAGLLARLEALAAETVGEAALALIEIDGLAAYNAAHGYGEGDAMLLALARAIGDETARVTAGGFCSRLHGGRFAIVVAECDEAAARVLGERLRARLSEALASCTDGHGLDFVIGFCSGRRGARVPELLAAADHALAAARHLGAGTVVIDWQSSLPELASRAWQQRLQRALAEQRFFLVGQGVFALVDVASGGPPRPLQTELLARLRLDDGEALGAAQFVPMAARHGLLEAIDRACLDQFFALSPAPASVPLSATTYSFNLSADALRRPEFTRWLGDQLAQLGARAASLIFEVSVFAAQAAAAELADLMRVARRYGVLLTIDQYGLNSEGFQVLRAAAPDYVKLAGSLLVGLEIGDEKHFYLESVCAIARALGVPLIATCVERPEHLPMLRSLGVHAAQGRALAPPGELVRSASAPN